VIAKYNVQLLFPNGIVHNWAHTRENFKRLENFVMSLAILEKKRNHCYCFFLKFSAIYSHTKQCQCVNFKINKKCKENDMLGNHKNQINYISFTKSLIWQHVIAVGNSIFSSNLIIGVSLTIKRLATLLNPCFSNYIPYIRIIF
jgi:hypothetical protein